ncbi:MAG: DNA-3-methyladenine glycosylase I [Alphaproteobacteria bacterium GM7ARS4]|nr:DNA-3-methyladenine glycosylase I [Alphaproteobacteria bacterium GM7ARS4]
MSWYCDASKGHPWHGPYHDHVYGFPVEEDSVLFERLVLELNQAGLSWLVVLRKEAHFRQAFSNFAIEEVARYGVADKARLMADKGIIRNRLKIEAAIHNAGVIVSLSTRYGSFKGWLDAHHPCSLSAWVVLFRKTFRFMGREIVNEFLMSTGYLPGAHREDCPVYERIKALHPPWCLVKPLKAWGV